MQTPLTEIARAKINLSLRVRGRRPDGYHELDSLVAFADFGDALEMLPGQALSLVADGPFASAIDGENLIAKAVAAVIDVVPSARSGRVRLTKNLPVAAGIGGGSADAAAMLRLLMRANPGLTEKLDVTGLALRLGADVPVCLDGRAARMTGIGETVTPIAALPELAILLVNPRVPLRTVDVFRALAAPPIEKRVDMIPDLPDMRTEDGFVQFLMENPNDLEATAVRLCPLLRPLLDCLRALPGVRLARMSGSGPTCFALFARIGEAQAAAATLHRERPEVWAVAARLV